MIVGVTGHRPPRLGLSYEVVDEDDLTDFALRQLRDLAPPGGVSCVSSGGALGWDMACIRAATCLRIPVSVYLPFKGHGSKWPAEQQERVRQILERPGVTVRVLEGLFKNYKSAYLARDQWVVQDSDQMLALYDGTDEGGTAYTIRYAQRLGKPVKNVYPQFQLWRPRMTPNDSDPNPPPS